MSENVDELVLEFYREQAFNVYASPEAAAETVASLNQIAVTFPDLHKELSSGNISSFLDVGCGGGWASLTVDRYYSIETHGIDFNPEVIHWARQVADVLEGSCTFEEFNLFEAEKLSGKYDLVYSMGVLHHTSDPFSGIAAISKALSDRESARLYLGLYHTYGRGPFLDYFKTMSDRGDSEEEQFRAFCQLHSNLTDRDHLRSWFRDQVLHPHESTHTLKEVSSWLSELGFEVVSTSINRFEQFDCLEDLFELEKECEQISYERNFREGKYYPGFFTINVRKDGSR